MEGFRLIALKVLSIYVNQSNRKKRKATAYIGSDESLWDGGIGVICGILFHSVFIPISMWCLSSHPTEKLAEERSIGKIQVISYLIYQFVGMAQL